MKTAAVRLQREFGEAIDPTTVEHVLHTSHDQFTADSAITRFLQAERFARQRLQALTRLLGEQVDDTPVVLFVSVHNASRSPMALGFFQHLAEARAVAWSAGTHPNHTINPTVIAAMAERDIDITREFPKPWTNEILHAADTVITISCPDTCPIHPNQRHLNWDLNTPADLTLDAIRTLRDDIEHRVRTLLTELDVPARD